MITIKFQGQEYTFQESSFVDLECWYDDMLDEIENDYTFQAISSREYEDLKQELNEKYDEAFRLL